MPTPDLIPTADVAERLGVDVRTVHRMVEAGRLAYVAKAPGLRGAYLFRREDVLALVNAETEVAS